MRSIYIGGGSVDDLGDAGGGEDNVLSDIARSAVYRRIVTEKSLWLLQNPDGLKVYVNEINDKPETIWGEVEDIAWLLDAVLSRLDLENDEFAAELAELMVRYGYAEETEEDGEQPI